MVNVKEEVLQRDKHYIVLGCSANTGGWEIFCQTFDKDYAMSIIEDFAKNGNKFLTEYENDKGYMMLSLCETIIVANATEGQLTFAK